MLTNKVTLHKEYIASLIGLPLKVRFERKNLCDGFKNDCLNFADVYSDTELDTIISWAIMYSNCNTFFLQEFDVPLPKMSIKYEITHFLSLRDRVQSSMPKKGNH